MKIPIDPLTFVPLVSWLVKLWAKTMRFDVEGSFQEILGKNEAGQPLIISLWHGELFPIIAYAHQYGHHFCVVVSQSKDGEFITRVLESFGVKGIRGSSSRGGVRVLLQGKRVIEKEKRIGVFTIDGPRGPRHKAKDGVLFLAQRAGAHIVPVRAFPNRKKEFIKSWDRFVLPLPFSRCQIRIGSSFVVTEEKLDSEVMTREKERLQECMHDLGRGYE